MSFIKRLINKVAGIEPVTDPNDIGTGSVDAYTLSLLEVIDRLGIEDEDDTANFDIEQEMLDE